MRSEGAANRWSLNSCAGGGATGAWEHAASSVQPLSPAKSLIGKIMPPAVAAVKQLPRVVVQHHGGRPGESKGSVVPIERIGSRILLVRGHKVLLDADLAALYGVETRVLNQAVKRNRERFPADFMFRLSAKEWDSLRSQFAALKTGRGQHRK